MSFNIDAKTGAPTGTPTSSPISQIMNPRQVLIDVTGQFLYLLDTNRVTVNCIDSQTGAVSEGAMYATSGLPTAAMSPNGEFFYATHWTATSDISGFSIDPMTGNLQELPWSPLLISVDPFSLVVDPSGKYLYAQSGNVNASSGAVASVYTIDPITGALNLVANQPFADSFGFGPGPLSFAY